MTKIKYDMETNSVSVREKKKSVKESPRQKCCVSERGIVCHRSLPRITRRVTVGGDGGVGVGEGQR